MTETKRYVLDAGALIAIETQPHGDLARRVLFETSTRRPPLLPTVVFAQVWRRSPRQHGLSVLRRGCTPLDFTDRTADQVGNLLARSATSDVVDAAVVIAAIEHHGEVITSDPDDLGRLADSLGYRLPMIAV